MRFLLAISLFSPAESADVRTVLNAMYQIVDLVEDEWAAVATNRTLASDRMKALTLAVYDANDGLSYLSNSKISGTRTQTVTTGLQRIRQHAVGKLDQAIVLGAPAQAARDSLASISTQPYTNWQPASYPAVFGLEGDYAAFNLASMKASEAVWHLYWDAVNYATPGVSPAWSAAATAECGQSVRDIRDLGWAMVRARATSLGAPILSDVGTREELAQRLLIDSAGAWVDLQIAEFGKNGCIGTLADLNGGEWTREQINWRAPKAIGDSSTDNRAAEWFSDFMSMGDIGPWVQAAFYPSSSECAPCGGECPSFVAAMVLLDGVTAEAVCAEVVP